MKMQFLKIQELDQKIKSLAAKERELLIEILEVIKEIDSRKMYLDLGYPNLFEYLTKGVGYSAGSAQRRIDAARLLQEEPKLADKIQSGALHLHQISLVQRAARQVSKERNISVTSKEKTKLLLHLENKNQREAEKEVASFFDLPLQQEQKIKAQKDESVRVELTLSKDLFEKIQQAQALLSHAVNGNNLIDYLEYVTERVIKQKTQVRTKAIAKSPKIANSKTQTYFSDHCTKKTSSTAIVAVTQIKSNRFSAQVKKQTFNLQKFCQYKDPRTGKQCQSHWFLQVDHKHSKWAGGNSSSENAQLLCVGHNRRKYSKEIGMS